LRSVVSLRRVGVRHRLHEIHHRVTPPCWKRSATKSTVARGATGSSRDCELGADGGGVKEALGKMMGKAKDLADSVRENDFLRLVGDIVMARQSEDTFKTFREAGKTLGNTRLQQIGDVGERHHDEYVKEANRLVQSMFVEHVRGDETGAATRSSADYSRERRPEL
jgi:hypothetical protein